MKALEKNLVSVSIKIDSSKWKQQTEMKNVICVFNSGCKQHLTELKLSQIRYLSLLTTSWFKFLIVCILSQSNILLRNVQERHQIQIRLNLIRHNKTLREHDALKILVYCNIKLLAAAGR